MKRTPLLFLNVIIIATCGLIYELIAGTLSSYVLGDSVTQFSFIIGIYLFAMGVGSYLSRFIEKNIAEKFIDIELAVAVVGGFSAPLLFLTFAYVSYFGVVLYSMVFVIGVLVGLEIPLLMRILKDELDFKELVSRVLALDYIGALVASLLFPIFLVPRLGLNRTSLLFGMLNAGVALWATWLLEPLIPNRKLLTVASKRVYCFGIAGYRFDQSGQFDDPRRGRTVSRQHCLRKKLALPADRRHARQDRPLAFLERQPAIQFVRRISLPRSTCASGICGLQRRAETRARSRRRGRPCHSRDPKIQVGRIRAARRSRSDDDRAYQKKFPLLPNSIRTRSMILVLVLRTRTLLYGSTSPN